MSFTEGKTSSQFKNKQTNQKTNQKQHMENRTSTLCSPKCLEDLEVLELWG